MAAVGDEVDPQIGHKAARAVDNFFAKKEVVLAPDEQRGRGDWQVWQPPAPAHNGAIVVDRSRERARLAQGCGVDAQIVVAEGALANGSAAQATLKESLQVALNQRLRQ